MPANIGYPVVGLWIHGRGQYYGHFAYKAVNNTELHIKHYKIRNICRLSVFFSALYAKWGRRAGVGVLGLGRGVVDGGAGRGMGVPGHGAECVPPCYARLCPYAMPPCGPCCTSLYPL